MNFDVNATISVELGNYLGHVSAKLLHDIMMNEFKTGQAFPSMVWITGKYVSLNLGIFNKTYVYRLKPTEEGIKVFDAVKDTKQKSKSFDKTVESSCLWNSTHGHWDTDIVHLRVPYYGESNSAPRGTVLLLFFLRGLF